jgi:hypothetical protein
MSIVSRREFLAATGAGAATLALPANPVAVEEQVEAPAEPALPMGRKKFVSSMKLLDGRIVTIAAWQYGLTNGQGGFWCDRLGCQGPKDRSIADVRRSLSRTSTVDVINPYYASASRVIEANEIDPKLTVPVVTYRDSERGSLSHERSRGLDELWVDESCPCAICQVARLTKDKSYWLQMQAVAWPVLVKSDVRIRACVDTSNIWRWRRELSASDVIHDIIAWVSAKTERFCLLRAVEMHIGLLIKAAPIPDGAVFDWRSTIKDVTRLQ